MENMRLSNLSDLWSMKSFQRDILDALRGAEMHWYFVQGIEALYQQLYLPGILALLTGVEASLRVTMHQLHDFNFESELSDYRVLSNLLILQAREEGLPIEQLAFPGEDDFLTKLQTKKPNRVDVKIVALRNDLAHGNVLDFISRDLGEDCSFFTPECLLDIADDLLFVSYQWALQLGIFRSTRLAIALQRTDKT
jgi:hypothetical protein